MKPLGVPVDLPPLAAQEVHLFWGRCLDVPPGASPAGPAQVIEDVPWLSAEERERAARFHFERDRRRFLARRTWLRALLAAYTDRDPGQLVFEEETYGKPTLAPPAEPTLAFNLSHSHDWVLVGVTRAPALGVDVEQHGERTELAGMAERVFAPGERRTFGDSGGDSGAEGLTEIFFRGWTRKEAALKVTGEGFSREPRTLEVGLEPQELGRPWAARDEPHLVGHRLIDLEAPEAFSAALCVRAEAPRLRVLRPWDTPVELPTE